MKRCQPLRPVEMALYNVASLVAGFGAGFDIRVCNSSGIHPKLSANRAEEEEEERRFWPRDGYGQGDYEFSSISGYPHNTYHGQTRHQRPSINFDTGSKPVRFTDSPQHNQSSSYNQSPRRKSSSTSNDSSDPQYNYASPPSNHLDRSLYVPVEYGVRQDGYQYGVDYSNRTAGEAYHYLHEYGRADSRMPLQQDLSSATYYGSDPYSTERIYPEYMRHQDGYHAYENPNTSSTSSASTQWTPPTRHHAVTYGHRRTPSNVSNTSNSSSNVNPSFRLEDELVEGMGTLTHRLSNEHAVTLNVNYSAGGVPHPPPRSSRHNSIDSAERPTFLDVSRQWLPSTTTTPSTCSSGTGALTSSSSKTKYSTTIQVGSVGHGSPKHWGSGSTGSGGTPTNPTPPDSANTPSEDSSYVSASLHFSPLTPASSSGGMGGGKHVGLDGSRTLLDLPVEGQSQDGTVPLMALRNLSVSDQRPRKISGIELEREFL